MELGFWHKKKVLVAGGAGFIGSHLSESLVSDGANVTVIDNLSRGSEENLKSIRSKINFVKGDLTDRDVCDEVTKNQDVVLNLASIVGGIGYNSEHNSLILTHNTISALNLLTAASKNSVSRYLTISSASIYPKNAPIPTNEDQGIIFDPDKGEGGYALAKYVSEQHAIYMARETDMNIAIVRLFNCYGPREDFEEDTGHVIPVLINKIARRNQRIDVWGDGSQSRSFIYIDDCVRGLKQIIERFATAIPINWGNDAEVFTIVELLNLLRELMNAFDIEFRYIPGHIGHVSKKPDLRLFREKVDPNPKFISLRDGLEKTIQWYKSFKQIALST